MTKAQRRMLQHIRNYGGEVAGPNGGAQYWDVVNDWCDDTKMPPAFALLSSQRTMTRLVRDGVVTIDNDGYVHLTEGAR